MNHTAVIRETNPVRLSRGTPWTSSEIAELRRLAPFGAEVVAHELGRSRRSVVLQAARQRISLRQPGERRGRVLGQSTGLTTDAHPIIARIRADAAAGLIDLERMDRLVRLVASGADLCPRCTVRPIEVDAVGLCRNCHVRELAWAHEQETDRVLAERELDAARQRKHRAKKRDSGEEMTA